MGNYKKYYNRKKTKYNPFKQKKTDRIGLI
jgi:hypothetical protein